MSNPTPSCKFPRKWKSGNTTVIRVPIALKDQIIAIAKELDDQLSNDGKNICD